MLYFDAYVQVRKLSELQAALALFRGKALRYVPSDKVVPLEVSVDTSGFMAEAAVVARREMQKVEAEARRAYKQRLMELSKDRSGRQDPHSPAWPLSRTPRMGVMVCRVGGAGRRWRAR